MKNNRSILSIIVMGALLMLAGCSTVVERAEKAHWTAFQTTDAFLAAERSMDNAGMRDEQVHAAAEWLRTNAPPIFLDTFDVIQDYKASASPEGKVEIDAAIKVLNGIAAKATKYIHN